MKKSTAPKLRSKFLIVAIGASAGGLEAITELLRHLPAQTGMAYIYIQHLDPNHKSMLTEILSKVTKMKVTEATQKMKVSPDTFTIIPPDQDMQIIAGVIQLRPRKPKPGLHMPIDEFFISLAESQEDAAIGIILSGTANDGIIGLKNIRIAGGLTIAQDESAKFQGMPKSAIAEDVVDMVLAPAEIAQELVRLSGQRGIVESVLRENPDGELGGKDPYLGTIMQMLKKFTGVDFQHYKINTIKRRIVRRMILHRLKSLKDYAQYLRQHAGELPVLYRDLLINVTCFFRDADTMEYLKKTILANIVRSKATKEGIRIWVPACSTGEEAYSIAILLVEILGEKSPAIPTQIFATDLSEYAIAKARLGLYSRNDLANVSIKRLARFFVKVDGGYRIIKTIRDLCVFAPHNVFKDPPFSRLDLISCCNLMIYLDNVAQKKVLTTFHYALANNGFLMLGKSETTGAATQFFAQLEKRFKVFTKKKDVSSNASFELAVRTPEIVLPNPALLKKVHHKQIPEPVSDLEKLVDEILLSKYIPPGVVVNTELEILQFRGSTSLFLEPSPGKASLNLLKMARPGLAFELRNTIHKANKAGTPIKKGGLQVKIGEILHHVSIEVVPLKSENEERLLMVLFREQPVLPAEFLSSGILSKDKLVKQLQDELTLVREDMRSIIEEQEESNEQLQSANEEIVSSNEELQSINEEMETSKEELESSNEELMTINSELQTRNEQLAESYEYSEAVFDTVTEAVIILDKDLKVKTANKSFYQVFKTDPTEAEGILIYEVKKMQWNLPVLKKMLEEILRKDKEQVQCTIEHRFRGVGKLQLLINARKIVKKIHQGQLIIVAIQNLTKKSSG